MAMATVLDRAIQVVAKQLGVDKADVMPKSSFVEDLKADSLDLVELMMALEEEFGIDQIPDEDAEKIKTVQEVIDYLKSRGIKDE